MLITTKEGFRSKVFFLIPEAPVFILENLKSSTQALKVCAMDIKDKNVCRSINLTSMSKPIYQSTYKEESLDHAYHIFGTSDTSLARFTLDPTMNQSAYKPYTDIFATEQFTAYLQYSSDQAAHKITVVRKGKSTLSVFDKVFHKIGTFNRCKFTPSVGNSIGVLCQAEDHSLVLMPVSLSDSSSQTSLGIPVKQQEVALFELQGQNIPVYMNQDSREIMVKGDHLMEQLIPPSECFSVAVDKQYVLIFVQTLTKDTVSLYVIDFTATDKKLNEFIIADVPKKVKAGADRLSTMQCRVHLPSNVHCVQAGSGAVYFEMQIDYINSEANISRVIVYNPIHNLLNQKILTNTGRKFFLIAGQTQPHQVTRKQYTVVLYHNVAILNTEPKIEAYVSGGLRLPYQTLVAANQTHLITSQGSYLINEKIELKKIDISKLVDVYGGSVFDQDKIPDPIPDPIEPIPDPVVPKPDPVDPKPKPVDPKPTDNADKQATKNDGGKLGSFIVWTVVALVVLGAVGYAYIAYRKHSVLKNRYYIPKGRLNFNIDDVESFLSNSKDHSLNRSGLKLE